MTDVVAIAKKCRAELATEIARLDEFIRMAEKLQQYEALAASANKDALSPNLSSPSATEGGARIAAGAKS